MFSETLIQKMKQNNISVDAGKTKEHVSRQWKLASKGMQNDILNLAGVARSTVHRAYRTGRISAKLAMAMAQVLDVDPFFLSGAADNPGVFGDEQIEAFLRGHKYGELYYEWRQGGQHQQMAARWAPSDKNAGLAAEDIPKSDELTEEELVVLLHALIIKARSDTRSEQILVQLKQLLLG